MSACSNSARESGVKVSTGWRRLMDKIRKHEAVVVQEH